MVYVSGCPCLGCGDRCVNCHSTCDKYKEWKVLQDKARTNERRNAYLYGLAKTENRKRFR